MKILVTGVAGFIRSEVAQKLAMAGHEVVGIAGKYHETPCYQWP